MNKYKIKERLGKGNFGEVYKACKKDNEKELYAIKVLDKLKLEARNEYLLTALQREIDIMKKMDIEQSVKLCDNCEDEDNYYMVMELCDTDLKRHIKKNKKIFNELELYEIMKQFNKALSKLREYDIVHRDLKPDNIMLKYDKAVPILGFRVKLADYGFSKQLNLSNTETQVGTPIYQAPEIWNCEEHNAKVDLWSIGVILYQLAFNQFPFPTNNKAALVKFINTFKTLKFPENIITDTLKDLIIKLLVKDQNQRISFDDYFKHKFFTEEHHEILKKKFDTKEVKTEKKNNSLVKTTTEEFEKQFQKLILIKEYKGLKIYKGKDKKNNKKILIKEISCSIINESENNKKIMKNEIELLQSLKAKEFPECYGIFQTDKYYYIIIEYFAGNFLKDFIRKRQYNISDKLINSIDIHLKNIFAELQKAKIKLEYLCIDNFAFSHYQNSENFKIKLFDYGLISIFSKEEQNQYEKLFNTKIKNFSEQKDLKVKESPVILKKPIIDDYGIDTILEKSKKKIEYLINYFENLLTNKDYILDREIYSSCYKEILTLLNFCDLECESILKYMNGDSINYMNGKLELIKISSDQFYYSTIDLEKEAKNNNLFNKENISFPYYLDKFRNMENQLHILIQKFIGEYKYYIFNDSEFALLKTLEEEKIYIKKNLGKIVNKCGQDVNLNKLFKLSFEQSNVSNYSKEKDYTKFKVPLYIFEYIIFINMFNLNIDINIQNNEFFKIDNGVIIASFIGNKFKSSKNNDYSGPNDTILRQQKKDNEYKIIKLTNLYDGINTLINNKNKN